MTAFQNFMTKAAELYLSAPNFFNWGVPGLLTSICIIIGFAYWLGGKLAESENNGLKAAAVALDQRLNFAKEQATVSTKEAEQLKELVEKLKTQIGAHAPLLELQNSTSVIDGNINRLVSANNAVNEALDHYKSTGLDSKGQLIWKFVPMRER